MSLLVQAQTSDDDEEIRECLQLVLKSSRLGLIHESVNVEYSRSYTSEYLFFPSCQSSEELTWMILGSWFAWANGVFAATILDLAKRKPNLIFKDPTPYEV